MNNTKCAYASQTRMSYGTQCCRQPDELPGELSLAMAYVPFQKCIDSYDEAEALKRGTLYPVLDKPFYGYLFK